MNVSWKPERWDPLGGVPPRPDQLPVRWTGGLVGARLVEAFGILQRMPGDRTGRTGSSGIAYMHSFEDMVGWSEARREEVWSRWERIKPGAHPWEVSRMEEAFGWPAAYLQAHPGESRCLLAWALCRGSRRSISRELRKRGWSRATFDRRRRAGCERIADGLNRNAVCIR